jgi:hypothetical protein
LSDFKRELKSNPLTVHPGMMWTGPISVGTPAVEFQVNFDTGSSFFFLADENCRIRPGRNRYDPKKSSTAVSLEKPFQMGYFDGSGVSGFQYTDTVAVAGLTATGQTLGVAKEWALGYETPADGILGMCFQGQMSAHPVFQTLMRQTTVPIFAFKFADEGAEVTLGGLKEDLFTGGVTYARVTEAKFWKIVFNSLNVGGEVITKETPCIVDSVGSKYCLLTLLD